jgi:hypothetical protein
MQTAVASYDSGMRTLVASWAEYARGATGAAVRYFSGVAVAVFPAHPEREFYDNALLDRGLTAMGYADAVDAVECAYGASDIDRYAVWVHEGDTSAVRHLELRDSCPRPRHARWG